MTRTIVRTPGTYGGRPRISGTRITVECVVEFFMAGDSHQTIANAYGLDVADVETAIRWHMKARRKR